ncbi:MAG: hypothetical protein U1B78_06715, partial [Dehalococcoidia bacterium]|nr:hypothetical protein [Dehalococcoidia bacterium]
PLIRSRIDPASSGIDVRPLDDEGVPQVRLSFRKWLDKEHVAKRRYEKYELLVREVHWAQAFEEPSFGGLAAGLVKLLTTWLRRALRTGSSAPGRFFWLLGRLLRRIENDLIVVVLMIVLLPIFIPVAVIALVGGWGGWLRRPGPGLRRLVSLYAKFQPSVVELAVFVAWPLILLLYIALVVIESMGPLRALLPDAVAKARRAVAGVATTYLGDVWAYAGQPWEASQIRTRFERRFQEFVDDEGEGAEAMFVIAHSLGCPVSYEGMSGGRMTKFIEDRFGPGKLPLLYFTAGSALPAIWAVVPDDEAGRLHRPLTKHVHWEDFISEYDPVQSDFICAPIDPPAEVSLPTVPHHVVNQMDLFSEHNAYWNNAEQVLAPILDVITDRQFHDELRLQ